MASAAPTHETDASDAGPTRGSAHPRSSVFERRQRRRMTFALIGSALFHLSMITLFEIVIIFPREDLQYYQVSIVSSPESPAPAAEPATSAAPRTGDALALGGTRLFDDGLPAVELPVVEFAELERLRIRYDASDPMPALPDLLDDPAPGDSWARFGGELHRLGQRLRDLALPGDETGPASTTGKQARRLIHRPAEGFEAHIEWSAPPHDRELLFAPPIKALWRLNPAELRRDIEIVFKVDPSGRVTNVWSPLIDEDGLIDDVQITALQYRFAPLSSVGADEGTTATPSEQSGILFIRAAGGAP